MLGSDGKGGKKDRENLHDLGVVCMDSLSWCTMATVDVGQTSTTLHRGQPTGMAVRGSMPTTSSPYSGENIKVMGININKEPYYLCQYQYYLYHQKYFSSYTPLHHL